MGKLIGLTGNIGSGKSTVGRLLREEGFFVVDADKLIHRLYEEDEELKEKVKELFGEEVFTEGRVDRKKLARVVFSDLKKLRGLEEITHSALYRELERLRKEKEEPVVVEASLIFEKGTEGRY
ncbi:MAG: dephospho-CoA kinase, partial [Aquificae bacterium]|nr:dephospho-CoA kinase [Aquificota bacterium]